MKHYYNKKLFNIYINLKYYIISKNFQKRNLHKNYTLCQNIGYYE